jgi:ABC-type multidrug transport system fused ATPase/permease subunit
MVIAHRLETIMDCASVLVLSAGRLVEHVDPAAAIQSKRGAFYELVLCQSGHGVVS